MKKKLIKQLIEKRLPEDGLIQTGIPGVQLFRATEPIPCAPAVYEPTVVVIVSGEKEAIVDGKRYLYDSNHYLCCPISMPVEVGTPLTSPDNPLLGVVISLDNKVMTELVIEMENAQGVFRKSSNDPCLALSRWDDGFTDALLRLLQLGDSHIDSALLGEGRLRELYYAILKGQAGDVARNAFAVGNEITRAIDYLSTHLDESVTIDDLSDKLGMSRAVLHRKFKQATSMSPIQFVKAMRLNKAAMQIAVGVSVNQAAMQVGYVSSSQFSREFKRVYGSSPKQWASSKKAMAAFA